jgi:hypothetical protein
MLRDNNTGTIRQSDNKAKRRKKQVDHTSRLPFLPTLATGRSTKQCLLSCRWEFARFSHDQVTAQNRAVNWLSSRAHRAVAHCDINAELLHYHRHGQFVQVLWVIEKVFHVAVLSETVKRRQWHLH